jgi:uncharacterized membrane protein YkgB
LTRRAPRGAHPWRPEIAALGGFLIAIMSLVTLSFLMTTPESWVPALGDANYGFPYLSVRGRLVIKDVIMLGAGLVVMADSAKACLSRLGRPRFRPAENQPSSRVSTPCLD